MHRNSPFHARPKACAWKLKVYNKHLSSMLLVWTGFKIKLCIVIRLKDTIIKLLFYEPSLLLIFAKGAIFARYKLNQ